MIKEGSIEEVSIMDIIKNFTKNVDEMLVDEDTPIGRGALLLEIGDRIIAQKVNIVDDIGFVTFFADLIKAVMSNVYQVKIDDIRKILN